jgi:phage tail-like protein
MLDLNGVEGAGFFTEMSGLGSETEIVEHKVIDGNGNPVIQKLPGRSTWGDIELKRGITSNMELWDWRRRVIDGDIKGARSNGTITMLDSQMSPVARWDFVNAWPSKIEGPNLDIESNDIGIESITIVHEGIERVS